MRLLGAILAGGASRRFGRDKALVEIEGTPMLDRVLAALQTQADGIVLCGRDYASAHGIPDRPEPGMGPLGGLCAALNQAVLVGFDAVLSVPCDVPDLPADLREQLGIGPSYMLGQPVIGVWPAALSPRLDQHLIGGGRSMRSWIDAVGAVAITPHAPLTNINTPDELRAWEAGRAATPGLIS